MRIPFIGKTSYYRLLSTTVYPCVWAYSLVQQNRLLEEIQVKIRIFSSRMSDRRVVVKSL